jgi:UDPglucose 6-dehydrogenase
VENVMKIAVIGTGYVGLVTGTCLADAGHDVTCIDKDTAKIERLQLGQIPIYEPGLDEMVVENALRERLHFTADLACGVADADVVFLAVGTPQGDDGGADLSGIWAAGVAVARCLTAPKTIVIKSTVPVGTNAELARRMAEATDVAFDVASNPEFLKEGSAIADFVKPDRVVVGVRRHEVADRLREIYAPIVNDEHPFLVMTPESAEMTKYVANCLLATKISFINEMANLCGGHGADIDAVRQGIGHDRRIGFQFLQPGPGYGGSCFPKDVRAAIHMGRQIGAGTRLLEAVDAVNEEQKELFASRVVAHIGPPVRKRVVAVWGLAFKARTDDIRESPALTLIDRLLAAGATVRVTDPEAIGNVRAIYGNKLQYFADPYEAARGAEVLAVVTEWDQYRTPDFARLRYLMCGKAIFDGRNLFDAAEAAEAGFAYHDIGRGGPARARRRPVPASAVATSATDPQVPSVQAGDEASLWGRISAMFEVSEAADTKAGAGAVPALGVSGG